MAFTYKTTKEEEAAKKQQQKDEQNLRNHQTYTPGEYQQSDWLKDTWNNITNMQAPTWDKTNNTWWNKLTDTMNAIENREKFSYDVNGDALYQQYKDQYSTMGNMAMMDTVGQATAMTGGYGNSYAQSVGQQTYQGYMQQLTDKIPELYQLALDQYNREGDDMYYRLSAYGSLYGTEYGEYRDSVTDFNNERSNLTNLYGIKSDEEYSQWYNDEQMKMTASEQKYQKLANLLGISTEQAKYIHDIAYQAQKDNYSSKNQVTSVTYNPTYSQTPNPTVTPDPDPVPEFTGGTLEAARDYIMKYTGDKSLTRELHGPASFYQEVRSSGGTFTIGGKKYTKYQDYLKDYVEYAMSKRK
jgi:hypothetical protein